MCAKMVKRSAWMLAASVATELAVSAQAWSATADPAISANLQQQSRICAEGQTPGTVGHSINEAMRIHTRYAATPVDTDGLFSEANDCFAQLRGVLDLSTTTPSYGAIAAAAAAALRRWAERKVCSTVLDMADRVLDPVNLTMQDVNRMSDLNGVTNGMIREGMGELDPDLARVYRDAAPAERRDYELNRETFERATNGQQTDNADNAGRVTRSLRQGKGVGEGQASESLSGYGKGKESQRILGNMQRSLERQRKETTHKLREAEQQGSDRQQGVAASRPGRGAMPESTNLSQESEDEVYRGFEGSPEKGQAESESEFGTLQGLFSR